MKAFVKFDELEPEPVEILVEAIIKISDGMKKINATRLTRKGIVTLIQYSTGLSRQAIISVIENLSDLEKTWLKSK